MSAIADIKLGGTKHRHQDRPLVTGVQELTGLAVDQPQAGRGTSIKPGKPLPAAVEQGTARGAETGPTIRYSGTFRTSRWSATACTSGRGHHCFKRCWKASTAFRLPPGYLTDAADHAGCEQISISKTAAPFCNGGRAKARSTPAPRAADANDLREGQILICLGTG